MNAHWEWENVLAWLLNHSWQAGMLVLLVLSVQWIFRRQLTNRWRFALWWIVLVRLLLPFSPPSPLSLFNFAPPKVALETSGNATQMPSTDQYSSEQKTAPAGKVAPAIPATPAITYPPARPPAVVRAEPSRISTLPKQNATPAFASPTRTGKELLIPVLGAVWFAGVAGLTGLVAAQLIRFKRKLARATGPTTPHLQSLLDDCRREFRIARRIELVETDAVQSPALFGLIRLRLLIPPQMNDKFSDRELRYVFLHEAAHVKRGDLWLNWLVTALQILHWFNPLLWLGFARLRADRELACDELALLRTGETAGTAYGETVVKLLEYLNQPVAIPGLVGILEDKKQMRRRISMIARFRRPGRRSVLAAGLIAALAAAALTDAQTNNPTELKGVVLNNDGTLLAVPATVFIATAAPKVGTSTFCPSCYLDCAKHAQTDGQSSFKIESLDPQLTFRILAVAKGYQPQYVSDVDPARGRTVRIRLKPIESSDASPDRSIRGRVVDTKGEPIEGAVVDMQGTEDKTGGGSWGMLAGVDPLAVTDSEGEFLLTAKKPFAAMDVKVEARTFADKLFNHLASGGTHHELVMTEGATLTGRVLRDGKPLEGVTVGISSVERQMGHYLGNFNIGTGKSGTFAFVNLPPNAEFWIYTEMDSARHFGAAPLRQIHTGKDGETIEAGDLIVAPGHRLAGRVVLADGKPLAPNSRLLISRSDAWDSEEVILDKNGEFDTTGIPSEVISVSIRVNGYHASEKNMSLDRINPFQLVGRVDHDITGLVFLLENGPEVRPDYSQVDPGYNERREGPLRGAEGKPDHSHDWVFSGHVLDSDTKEPILNFKVTPGQVDNFNQTSWITAHAVDGTNGDYSAYVSERVSQPLLKAEADGYLPQSVPLTPGGATNVDMVLQKGSGPAGTVVNPDGQPAVGAKVAMLDDGWRQPSLNAEGELTSAGTKAEVLTAVDAKGSFAFKPLLGMKSVVAASAAGFAAASIESLATNPIIHLKPYGKITGTLQRTSGPGTNEILDVAFSGSEIPQLARFSLFSFATTTDPQGKFVFDHIPSGHMQISYRVPMNHSQGWMNQTLQEVELQPGQTVAVTITTTNREVPNDIGFEPPPPPAVVPGAQVKGVVLLPDGKPAAEAQVVLQVDNIYLALGKGRLTEEGEESGMRVRSGPDGSFTLPMYDKARSVIALNDEGYAQVSLEQLKSSSQITLQKWGTIAGVLRIGHHLGTNELVEINPVVPGWTSQTIQMKGKETNSVTITNSSPIQLPPPFYDPNAFQARTDNNGRFVITFVPPGKERIMREIATGNGGWMGKPVVEVDLKPGETITTNIGGNGRTVIGKVKFADQPAPDFKKGQMSIATPMSKLFEKVRLAKTDEERRALYQSEEFQTATKDRRDYFAAMQPDGSFQAEDVLPGKYEVNFQQRMDMGHTTSMSMFTGAAELTVPDAKDKDDDSAVDRGEVELKTLTIPMLKPTVGGK